MKSRNRFFGLVGVESHVTPYTEERGCFPLCEGCWSALTPEERVPYYENLWISWVREYAELGLPAEDIEPFVVIRDAVLTEETYA